MTIARALARGVSRSFSPPTNVPVGPPRSTFGGLASLSGGTISGMDAYRGLGAAYGPIRRICESVALTDWALYQQSGSLGNVDRTLIDDATAPARHPATALWTQCNPFMTRRVFLFIHQLFLETAGGCYWLLRARGDEPYPFESPQQADIELWPIRPDRITPVTDPDKYLLGYWYRPGGNLETIPLDVAALVPVGYPDPADPLRFAGPLQAMLTDLESEAYASQHTRNTFLNGAQPGGVIQFDQPLTPERWEEIVLRWREQHQGVANVGRVAIIEGGKWVETGMKITDMDYVNLRRLGQEEVMYALGMPYAMQVTHDVNLANATIGEKIFYRWTLRPRLEIIKESLNHRLLPFFGSNLTMDYDLPEPEDEAFDTYQATMGWLAGYLTKNEARQGTGYDAVDDGDVYVYELTGTPPAIPPAVPPKKPTTLSYRAEHPAQAARDEQTLARTWGPRLEEIRAAYLDLLSTRNGGH